MRPNLRAIIGSITFWISSMPTIMLAVTPSSICWRLSWRKSRKEAGIVVDQDVGSGQAACSAFDLGRGDVGCDRDHLGAGCLGDLVGGRLKRLAVAAVDHDLAAASAKARAQALPSPRSTRRRWPCGRRVRDPWGFSLDD